MNCEFSNICTVGSHRRMLTTFHASSKCLQLWNHIIVNDNNDHQVIDNISYSNYDFKYFPGVYRQNCPHSLMIADSISILSIHCSYIHAKIHTYIYVNMAHQYPCLYLFFATYLFILKHKQPTPIPHQPKLCSDTDGMSVVCCWWGEQMAQEG